MNKKTLIIILAAVAVVVVGVVVYMIYSGSDYAVYSGAFQKTFGADSMELETLVTAESGGTVVEASGNFKLKGISSTPQFVNVMTIGGQTVTQFCDGQFIYTDDGANKNKIAMGGDPAPRQEREQSAGFSMDAYIEEFSGLLDASKIRQLNSLEPVAEQYVDSITKESSADGGTSFIVNLLPQAVDTLVDSFLSENISDASLSPTVEVNEMAYIATVKNGYVDRITFSMIMDVTAPGGSEAQETTVMFSIHPINPGQAVEITLPSTEGF